MNPFESPDTGMSKKQPLPPDWSQEDRSALERAIDARLEQILLYHARKINEGNNGVIFRADRANIPPSLIEELRGDKIDLTQGPAMKLLKVYVPGAGRREFDIQTKVRELIVGQKDRNRYARVPYLVFYRDLWLRPAAAAEIKKVAPGLDRIRDRVEIIGMDYVPGEDLAQILYREALLLAKKKNMPEAQFLTEEEIKKAELPWLHLEVSRIFYAKPVMKGASELERRAAEEAVFRENFAGLMKFLRSGGLRLQSAIFERVRDTLNLFHQNGIVYRDGHARNIMIVGEPFEGRGGEAPEVYMIDYGGSAEFSGNYTSQHGGLYEDAVGGRKFLFDEDIVEKLRQLSEPIETRTTFDWLKLEEEGRKRHKAWEAMLLETGGRTDSNIEAALEKAFASFMLKGVDDLRFFAAFVRVLTEKGDVDREAAAAFVERKMDEKAVRARPMVQTAMQELLAELKKTPS